MGKKARWEFPAGHLENHDTPLQAAIREWEEETGAKFPKHAKEVGTWKSPDGKFQGFVFSIPSQSAIEFSTVNGEEISAVSWWDINDLDDDYIRDKVTETLDRIEPLISQAVKSANSAISDNPLWYSYHKHTDAIIQEYTQRFITSFSKVVDSKELFNALRQLSVYISENWEDENTIAKTQKNPSQPATTTLSSTPTTVPPATPVAPIPPAIPSAIPPVPPVPVIYPPTVLATWATSLGFMVTSAGTLVLSTTAVAANVAAGVFASLSAFISFLLTLYIITVPLANLLKRIYAEAYIQSTHELEKNNPNVKDPFDLGYNGEWPTTTVNSLIDNPPLSLQRLFAQIPSIIHEITHTQLMRIYKTIQHDLTHHISYKETVANITAILKDPHKASQIVENEYCRAYSTAAQDYFTRNSITMIAWVHQPGACARCMENAAVSPLPVTQSWPNGSVLVHPMCRCLEVPYETSTLSHKGNSAS